MLSEKKKKEKKMCTDEEFTHRSNYYGVRESRTAISRCWSMSETTFEKKNKLDSPFVILGSGINTDPARETRLSHTSNDDPDVHIFEASPSLVSRSCD